jgi:septation ring formation regulator EzrA
MRNAIFLTLGFLEITVAIILVGFGCQLPGPAEVDKGFKRADAVIDHAGSQVRMMREQVHDLRRPEVQELTSQLRTQTKIVTGMLKEQKIDFDQVQIISNSLGDAAAGLEGISETLDADALGKLGKGLGTTASYLDEKLAPTAGRTADHLDKVTAILKADAKKLSLLLKESASDPPPAIDKQQGRWETLLKEVPEHSDRLAEELPKITGELSQILRDTQKLKEVGAFLRQAQKSIESASVRWPELRKSLSRSAFLLRSTQTQLQQTLKRRKEYETALKQMVTLADAFATLLPLYSQQIDAHLQDQERSLDGLNQSINEVNKAIPPFAQTASRLVQTGRLLVFLVAGIVALHGAYLSLSARLGKQFSL